LGGVDSMSLRFENQSYRRQDVRIVVGDQQAPRKFLVHQAAPSL
jgi:hypothetical protein